MTPVEDDRLLTVPEVAYLLGMSKAWICSHTTRGQEPKIPYLQFGGRKGSIRFRKADVEQFIAAMRHRAEW